MRRFKGGHGGKEVGGGYRHLYYLSSKLLAKRPHPPPGWGRGHTSPPPPTSHNWGERHDTGARPGRTPASSPNTHNSPLPVFSQFFIHSTGTNTVAAAIFPSLLAGARMCSMRARGQSEAPPTKNAGNCELAIRFPAPVSHLRPAEARGPWPTKSPKPVGPFAVTSRAAPSATLALASPFPRPIRSPYLLP